MTAALDIEVRDLLNKRRGDWRLIAEQSGVSYSWISKFVNGHIPNPGYATLRDLRSKLHAPDSATPPPSAPPAPAEPPAGQATRKQAPEAKAA